SEPGRLVLDVLLLRSAVVIAQEPEDLEGRWVMTTSGLLDHLLSFVEHDLPQWGVLQNLKFAFRAHQTMFNLKNMPSMHWAFHITLEKSGFSLRFGLSEPLASCFAMSTATVSSAGVSTVKSTNPS